MRLLGKRILITGASRGLGRALAQRFAMEGAHLALCARSNSSLEAVHDAVAATGVNVLAEVCDVSNSQQVQSFVEHTIAKFSGIDVVINNASRLGPRVPIVDYSLSEWDETVQTNVNGIFFVTKFALPTMIRQKSGAIINVSSSVGKTGRARWGAYSVSKFALEGLTQILAEELRPHGISVNSVNPGPMATDLRRAAYPEEDPSLPRTPEQLTEVFVYLASNDGLGISGQTFDASTYIANPR